MSRYPTEQILLILENSILVGLIFRVLVTGLFRTYRYFFGYLLVSALQSLVLVFLSVDRPSYIYPWLISQALLTFFCILIVLELYTLILRDLKGIASTSRWSFNVILSLAIVVSLLLLLLEQTPHTVVSTFMIIDSSLITGLLIFVLLMTAYLVYYPIPINRNLIVYSLGYSVFFTAKASALLVLNIHYAWVRQVGVVAVAASTVSMLFWLVGLSRKGEEKTLVIGHKWNPEDNDKVLERLKAINEKLLRAGKE